MTMAVTHTSNTFRILIVGGGIAGLAAAIALRAPGRSILILEQSSQSQEIGATISLQPNASKIVEKEWGLGSKLKAKGSMIDEAFRICSTNGKEHTRINLRAKVEYGGDRIVYHRQDLHTVLKDAATSSDGLGDAPTIQVSSRVVSCDCEEGSVKLENGETLSGFDLVIGADGIHSMVRTYVLGKEVHPVTTGVSAYRLMIKGFDIEGDAELTKFLDPRDSCTTMIMGHDCRLIMGPVRNGEMYSIVAMVPDKLVNENIKSTSWTSEGNMGCLLESFQEFPDWCKRLFTHAPQLGLWQLRDLEPLETWVKGRAIIIGDASHAMLPTQGQGASQSIEDAESLGAFFADISGKPSISEISARLKDIVETRKPRATLIQSFSRESAKPATDKGNPDIKIKTDAYMDFNCNYKGAKEWKKNQKERMAQVL